jgi:peptidoglycan/xylan/chitin deacetylase (PgdA/CDA1 family)
VYEVCRKRAQYAVPKEILKKMLFGLCAVLAVFAGVIGFCGRGASHVRASNDAGIILPILMYHSIDTHDRGKYIAAPTQFESDLIMLRREGFTTVFMSEVIDWVHGAERLPARPIVITMDDGHFNNMCYALEIAKRHNAKFMINPVTRFTEKNMEKHDVNNPRYSYLTFEQMRECVDSGLVEIGNHTHDMHGFTPRYGVMNLRGETDEHYTNAIKSDILHAQELITRAGVPAPTTFAYPFGRYNKKSREVLVGLGFRALLTCNEVVNVIKQGDPECLYSLGRFNRSGNYSEKKVLELITRAPRT